MLNSVYQMCIINIKRGHMKQRELVKKLEAVGFVFERHGGNHDVYRRGNDTEDVPRHREVNDTLARAILRKWGA